MNDNKLTGITIDNSNHLSRKSVTFYPDKSISGSTLKQLGYKPFDSSLDYNMGDIAIYANKLYEFTTNHKGEWDINDVKESNTVEIINKLKRNAYSSIGLYSEYLYEVTYDSLNYDDAKEYFKGDPSIANASCSAMSSNGYVGRNYDFLNNYTTSFAIHTPNKNGCYATVGMAEMLPITKQVVESGEYTSDYEILPFYLLDGVNEYGLFAEMNLVPTLGNDKTIPTLSKTDSISALMLVRYILDHYTNVTEAIDDLQKHIEIYMPKSLQASGYELHYMLVDASTTKVIEFVNNEIVATICNKLTNFHVTGVTFNNDGSVYTNYDVPTYLPSSLGIEDNADGLERWNLLNNASAINSIDDMKNAMDTVKFTQAYTITADADVWYSEFIHGNLTVDSPYTEFAEVLLSLRQKYAERSKDTALTWLTIHSSIYDIANKRFLVKVLETADEYYFSLSNKKDQWVEGEGANSLITLSNKLSGGSAKGDYAIAEGVSTDASALGSHTEGNLTIVVSGANFAHAEGNVTTAGGLASHAEGNNTVTNNQAEHAEGKFNKSNMGGTSATNTLHSIGIGLASGSIPGGDRKNAFEVMENGDVYIIGIGGYDGTNPATALSLQDVINSL